MDWGSYVQSACFGEIARLLRYTADQLAGRLSVGVDATDANAIQKFFNESLKGFSDVSDRPMFAIGGAFLVSWAAIRRRSFDDTEFVTAVRHLCSQISPSPLTGEAASYRVDGLPDQLLRYVTLAKGAECKSHVIAFFRLVFLLSSKRGVGSRPNEMSVNLHNDRFLLRFRIGEENVSRFRSRIDSVLQDVQDFFDQDESRRSLDSTIGNASESTQAYLRHLLMFRRMQYQKFDEQSASFEGSFYEDQIQLCWGFGAK
jgi:hypothetical protein